MIILDNIIFSLQKIGGISVVWYELLKHVLADTNMPLDTYFIEYKNNNNIFRKYLNIQSENIINKPSPFLFFHRYLNFHVKNDKKFIFHSSYYRTALNKNAINITTVHDFTYEHFSNGLKKKIHSWQKFRAIRNSDFIICISESTKKDLMKFLPDIKEERIRVIYNGVSGDYFPIINECDIQLPFPKNEYVLFVGNRAGYKNFAFAIETISLSKYNLVIVGPSLSNKEFLLLKNKIGESHFKHFGYISNQELNILYNNAFVLLYPSIYEGFGMPVIEAQRAGCPVIAYKGSSIVEIIGDTPLLIDDLSTTQILWCFNVLENNQIRMQIINNGLRNATRFTWDRMYNQVIELYKEAWS